MIRRLVTLLAGRSLARSAAGFGGPAATVAGVVLPLVLRRLGLGGMIAAAVAGRAVRHAARRAERRRFG
ncbi:MAG: hypothetical protein JO290_08215 [Sphingomonadaceae bacterium]|nr:hypothetical protein [Sphingomonadaceae bacterium]